MFTLATGESLRGVAGSASAITYTVTGDEKATTDAFKVLAQGQLPAVAAALYTVPASNRALVQTVFMLNVTAAPVTASLYINGTSGSNQIFGMTIPANGSAILAADGWKIYDSTGGFITSSTLTLTGDVTGAGSGSIATTIANNAVTNVKAADMPSHTMKGNNTAGTADPIDLTLAQIKTELNLAGTNTGDQNVFSTVTGNTGTASADSTTDSIAITGANGITTAATDTPDGLVITGPNAFGVVTGTSGTATADSGADTLVITGANGISTVATDTPDGLVITGANAFGAVTGNSGTATSDTSGDTIAITGSGSVSTAATDTPDGLVISNALATTSAAGNLSALDKLKLDNIWIDVTANSIALVTPAQSAATNTTNMATLLSGAPNGSTIFFPHGLYQFSGAWVYPAATAKMFIFKGEGSNRAGSPATTFTELRWITNVGGDIITLPSSGNGWYTEFQSLTFTSSATQSAGALVNINGNVGTNFRDCSFQSVATGQTFFDVLFGAGGATNSWNSAVIENCSFQGFTNSAIRVNASGSSLVISNCVIQGQWGTTAQIAAACVSGGWVGALQIVACDILGAVNNLLLNPVLASSEVCASVQCTNTYFDFAMGSCVKITGTGATVRCKWDTCTFTTSNAGTGFSAVEIAGSNVFAAGGQDLAFVNCNIYNTFATTGTTNGVLITNAADVSFTNCKVAGWTNGYNITPMASNKTNVQVTVGTVGPSGGFGGNSVGFLIAAGAYKGLQIRGCNVIGNTTNLTLGAVTVLAGEGSAFAITDSAGINPRGSVGVIVVPASAVAQVNLTGFRCIVMQRFTVVPTGYALNGVATVLPIATSVFTATVEPGGSITTTGGTYTWTWVGQ